MRWMLIDKMMLHQRPPLVVTLIDVITGKAYLARSFLVRIALLYVGTIALTQLNL
ncbi:hypothetical protein BDW71DRAFT_190996 [Aspergillus fruticulosus]